MNADNSFQYASDQYKAFLQKFRNSDRNKNQLIVCVGEFTQNRTAAIDEFKRETLGEAEEIDLVEVVTPFEEESYRNIDECVDNIGDDSPMVIFRNAEQLSGAYTGYTNSNVKYSTPQEKYFVKKVRQISAPVVLELSSRDQLGMSLARKADAVILFDPPSSVIEKIAWKFKNVRLHGSRFLSPRPIHK